MTTLEISIEEVWRIHILYMSYVFINCNIFLEYLWVCIELWVTLKTGTWGGERESQGGWGVLGFEGLCKGEDKRKHCSWSEEKCIFTQTSLLYFQRDGSLRFHQSNLLNLLENVGFPLYYNFWLVWPIQKYFVLFKIRFSPSLYHAIFERFSFYAWRLL